MIKLIESDVARAKKFHAVFRFYDDLCAIDVCIKLKVLIEIKFLRS